MIRPRRSSLLIALLVLLLLSCGRIGFGPSDPCSDVTCSGHGQCELVDGSARCNCDTGYHREVNTICSPDGDPCEGIDCSGHGQCGIANDGSAQCACEPGYHNESPTSCVSDLGCTKNSDCDDDLFCTGIEECSVTGTCKSHGNPCPIPEDCNETLNICGNCGDGLVTDGEDCDPGPPQLDTCCEPGDCTWVKSGEPDPQGKCGDTTKCEAPVCNGLGDCMKVFAPDGTPCDDDLFCTKTDECFSGSCIGSGSPCGGSDCDETRDACTTTCTRDSDCVERVSCTYDFCFLGICRSYNTCPDQCDDDCAGGCPANGCCIRECTSSVCQECSTGCSCVQVCSSNEGCQLQCRQDSVCFLAAKSVDKTTMVTCHNAACFLNCDSAGDNCSIDCQGESHCDLVCDSMKACDLDCPDTAECLLSCTSVDECNFTCPSGAVSCGSGVQVCNRPCP